MKVHVIGAGPAGSIAAMSALRSGFDVVVSEEHPVSGIPENCSGLFSRDGLDSLKAFVDYRKLIINPVHGADIYFAGEKVSVRRKAPVAFVCGRSALDQALASRAGDEGAKISYGDRVKDRFHADNIIGADGPLSSVARHFSFSRIRKYAATLQALVDYRCEDPNVVEVYLSNRRFPGFFAWVIPHDERTAALGIGVELPNKAFDAWKKLLKLKKIGNAPKPRGAIIPLEVRSSTAMRVGRKSVLLVGDAAGQVKSTTGGGVIFGGNCAALAGRYASNPFFYELEWRARYGLDLALHRLLHDYAASRPDSELASLGKRLKKLGWDDYLSKKGHMDSPTKMVGPEMAVRLLKSMAGVA